MQKNISVIVPVYYGEKYIAGITQQVEANKQNLDEDCHVELILVNDAPDAPLSYEWKSKFVQVIVINTEKNVGIHGARIKGLEECRGDYVLFLDQDDIISQHYLSSQLQEIGESDAVVCRAIQAEKEVYSEKFLFENIVSRKWMLTGPNPIVSPGQVLLKRTSIPNVWVKNKVKKNGADDWFLWLCMVAENCTFALNHDVLYEHVLTGENTSKDVVGMLMSRQEVMSIVQEEKLFSDEEFGLLLKAHFDASAKSAIGLHAYKKKWDALGKWMAGKGNKESYAEYLFQLGIQSVAIYGCGVMGEYLYIELKDKLNVRYFIDRNASKMHGEIPVYSLQDELPKVDGVVVTLMGKVDDVKRELQEKSFENILVLKEWLE